jgi:signal transduction histidine kinase
VNPTNAATRGASAQLTAKEVSILLSVTDDGIGMPTCNLAPKSGLGTGIVKALARNLNGEIQVSDANPGTAVTIGIGEAPIAKPNFQPPPRNLSPAGTLYQGADRLRFRRCPDEG